MANMSILEVIQCICLVVVVFFFVQENESGEGFVQQSHLCHQFDRRFLLYAYKGQISTLGCLRPLLSQ